MYISKYLPNKFKDIEQKYNKDQNIMYVFYTSYYYEIDNEIDEYDIDIINNTNLIKFGKTTIGRFKDRMREHTTELKENINIFKIIPIKEEKYEQTFHNSLKKYLNKQYLYVDFYNDDPNNKKKNTKNFIRIIVKKLFLMLLMILKILQN